MTSLAQPLPVPSAERAFYDIQVELPAEYSQFAHTCTFYGAFAISGDNYNCFGIMAPGGGVEPPRPEGRRILSRRGASAKSLKSEPFQSLRKCELREMCSSVRSRRDLSLTVCAQSGKADARWNLPRLGPRGSEFDQLISLASFQVLSAILGGVIAHGTRNMVGGRSDFTLTG
jgi:hypothetical protein